MKIGLIGATGRLGQEICKIAHPQVEITEQFHSSYLPYAHSPVHLFLDVSIDKALAFNLETSLIAEKPIVIGTTGMIDFEKIEAASRVIPVFYTPNFSIKMALLNACIEQFSHLFSVDSQAQIIETHHLLKKDYPSGSARFMKKIIEAITRKEVLIHSHRLGTIVGEHSVIFTDPKEEISLTHKAFDRKLFAEGAIEAALFLIRQPPGLYGMKDLLTERFAK